MPAITCPNCGRSGSLKFQLPPGATLRCKGCKRSFEPASEIRRPRQRARPSGVALTGIIQTESNKQTSVDV